MDVPGGARLLAAEASGTALSPPTAHLGAFPPRTDARACSSRHHPRSAQPLLPAKLRLRSRLHTACRLEGRGVGLGLGSWRSGSALRIRALSSDGHELPTYSAQASTTETSVEGPSTSDGGGGGTAPQETREKAGGQPSASEGTNQKQAGPSDPSPVAPRPRRSNRPASTNDSKGWLGWLGGLLPDARSAVFVLLHLSAGLLLTKLLGVDSVFRGLMQQVPSLRFIPAESAPADSRSARSRTRAGATGGSASSSSRLKHMTVLRDEAGRRPAHMVSNLVVPFSEFLFHVRRDNVHSVSVDGDKVSFVVKKADIIQDDHKAAPLLPDMRVLQRWIQEDERLRGELEATESSSQLKRSSSSSSSLSSSSSSAGGGRRGSAAAKAPFSLQLQLATVKPPDLALPYSELMAKNVEFGAPEKVPFRFINNASIALLYAGVLASIISRLTVRGPARVGGRQKSKKGRGPGVLFADVAGVDEAKEELEEIVEYLRMPERFTRLGARPPRGVLLVGPPGTGKTMLAKAVAGEADVPFVSCSGSEFVELYVGLGASRVRDLFAQAKKDAPSIVFIDEIDSVAKARDGRARSVGNDEREQTLNQLLTEMDGFDSNTAVIVLAATNRADVIDPALRRPGRFDRIVAVEPPDRRGRVAIMQVHIEKQQLPLAADVDVQRVATATSGFTGADLANLVNEAALLAARDDDCQAVAKVHFDKAIERAIAGIEKKRSALGRSEKAVVARHEVGHAILGAAVGKLLPNHPLVQKISIVPRSGGALGFAYIPPAPEGEERQLLFADEVRGQLATLLGGRAAEEVAFGGRVSTGALDDIRRATDLAYKGIAEYGLSSTLGPVSLSALNGGGSDGGYFGLPDQGRLHGKVQEEVQSVLQEALSVARAVVLRNLDLLQCLGGQLEEDESVEGELLRSWLDKVDPTEELREFIQRASLLPQPGLPILLPPAKDSKKEVQ